MTEQEKETYKLEQARLGYYTTDADIERLIGELATIPTEQLTLDQQLELERAKNTTAQFLHVMNTIYQEKYPNLCLTYRFELEVRGVAS